MKLKFIVGTALLLALSIPALPVARAESLLLQNVERERSRDLPQRGLSMAEVERRYGAPLDKLPTAGGGKPRQPPINRWRYADYTVYFERERVIHAVANPAS